MLLKIKANFLEATISLKTMQVSAGGSPGSKPPSQMGRGAAPRVECEL